jgi:hypothetical protein
MELVILVPLVGAGLAAVLAVVLFSKKERKDD